MSDDLRPPSLRDTRSLEDVVRHHGLLLSKLAPGLFGGRSRIPDPIELEDAAVDGDVGNDGDADEAEWWDEDRFVVTEAGTVTWLLTYVPIQESLLIRWHAGGGAGIAQISPENWTLGDDGRTVTILDPDGVLEVGDFFSAQYQFLDVVNDDPPDPIPASLTVIGATHVGYTSSSIPLPTGTEEGDLLVVVVAGDAGSTCSDARITTQHVDSGNGYVVGYGYADGSGDPVAVSMGTGGPTHSCRAELAAFRVTGEVHDRGYTARNGGATSSIVMPSDDMGILVLVGEGNTVPGPFDDDSTGNWTTVDSGGASYYNAFRATLVAYCATGTPSGSWSGAATYRWAALVIGLTEEVFT